MIASTKAGNGKLALLLDLDGTLLDTAPDLAYALNRTLQDYDRAPLPYAAIRPHVSHGASALVTLGFGIDRDHADFEPARQHLLAVYQDNLARETALFEGMDRVLRKLEDQGRKWGVVTNKPKRFTLPLMDALNLSRRASSIVSGDTLPQSKPDPAPMLLACEQMAVAPRDCLYVGDAQRDVEAGHRAGISTLVALFGYLGETDTPENWGADGLIEQPADIESWLS